MPWRQTPSCNTTLVGEFLEALAYPASPDQTSPRTVLVSKAAETEVTVLQEKLFGEDSLSPEARASHLSNAFLYVPLPQVAQFNGSWFGQP